jgi:hypothetical protein
VIRPTSLQLSGEPATRVTGGVCCGPRLVAPVEVTAVEGHLPTAPATPLAPAARRRCGCSGGGWPPPEAELSYLDEYSRLLRSLYAQGVQAPADQGSDILGQTDRQHKMGTILELMNTHSCAHMFEYIKYLCTFLYCFFRSSKTVCAQCTQFQCAQSPRERRLSRYRPH